MGSSSSVQARPDTLPQRIISNPFTWWGMGGCLTLFVLGVIGVWVVSSIFLDQSNSPQTSADETLAITRASQTIATPTSTSPTTLGVSTPNKGTLNTAIPSPILPTNTTQPSDTSIPPSSTPAPPTPEPTKPQGDYFVLYYNDRSLYFKNLSGKDRSIYPIAFERIKNGQFTDRFEGWRWGNIYSNFRAGYCVVLEIINTVNYLNPPECQNLHLVIRTPTSDDPYIFWTTQEGSNQFRVLWDDQEVTRCTINDKFCEVYLP